MQSWCFLTCRIKIQYQNGSACNHCDAQIENDRVRPITSSLFRRSISSHPSIGQVLNNIRPEDVLTELLLLYKIQRLESGARVPVFMSAPLVSLEGQGGAFKLLRARKREAITPQGTRDGKRTRERGGTQAGRSISGTCTIRQKRRPRSTFARKGGAGSRGLRGIGRTGVGVSEVTVAYWE